MTRQKTLLAILASCAALLTACAGAPETPVPSSPQVSAAAVTPTAPVLDSGDLFAPELELPAKVIPGCRSSLGYPLIMHGESTAADFSRWTATDLDGNLVAQEILKPSKLTLVYVWSTYCAGHAEELSKLQELYNAYGRADLNVVGIVASAQKEDGSRSEDEIGYVKYLLDMTGATFPQLAPSDDLIQIRLKDLDVMPESFLLDSAGNLVGESWIGPRSLEELKQTIDGALA